MDGWYLVRSASYFDALVQDKADAFAKLYAHVCAQIAAGLSLRSLAFKTMLSALYARQYEYAFVLFKRCANTAILQFYAPNTWAYGAHYAAAAKDAGCLSFKVPTAPSAKASAWQSDPAYLALKSALLQCTPKGMGCWC